MSNSRLAAASHILAGLVGNPDINQSLRVQAILLHGPNTMLALSDQHLVDYALRLTDRLIVAEAISNPQIAQKP